MKKEIDVPDSETEPITEVSVDSNTFVKADGNSVSSDYVVLAEKLWNQIPDAIKNHLIANGFQVIISEQPLNQRFGYSGSIAGITDIPNKIIYLDNRSSAIQSSLLHEVGHAIDISYGYPSQSPEFASLYQAEKGTFFEVDNAGDNHGTSSTLEYFAAVSNNILKTGDSYYYTAPQSYEFVKRYLQ